MTSEQVEEKRVRRCNTPQTLVAIAVAAAVGGVGGAAIYAATHGSAHAMGGAPSGQMHGRPSVPAGPPPAQPPPAPAAPTGFLHSEYVVPDGNGGFITKMTQTGIVDEVTLSQIVVRSDDGYTQIYEFPSAQAANPSVAANDIVTVEAARSGATLTLTSIGEDPPHGN